MTTALFLLRSKEIGLTMADLDDMNTGTVLDIFTEKLRDEEEWEEVATQEDFDNF